MKLIELHILQSFPVSCLNRDDLNSPKTAIFGGTQRARVSSQSWKRAIRLLAQQIAPERFAAVRTKLLVGEIIRRLELLHVDPETARTLALEFGDGLAKIDTGKENDRVTTLMFLSPSEFDEAARLLAESAPAYVAANAISDAKKKEKALKEATKPFAKLAKDLAKAGCKDGVDIAIFGRMVANDHSLTVEGSGLFSHALSTHAVDNEVDFYAAVDDLQPSDESGAGMTGHLEFNAPTFYRYVALNLDQLKANLPGLDQPERQAAVRAFLEAALLAVPGARRTSMNAATRPSYVLGLVRQGQPLQLANAFERPVRSRGDGLMAPSIDALRTHRADLLATWGDEPLLASELPETKASDFLDALSGHVQ